MYATSYLADHIMPDDVIITSVCPGWVYTNLGRDHFFPGVYVVAFFFILLFMRTPSQGSNMILSGTTQGMKLHNRFWRHDQIQPTPPSLKGGTMQDLGRKIVGEILGALKDGGAITDVQKCLDDAMWSN
jgi:hypothetical protein